MNDEDVELEDRDALNEPATIKYKGFTYQILPNEKGNKFSVKVFYRLSYRNQYMHCFKRIFDFDLVRHPPTKKRYAIFIRTPENQRYSYLVNLGKWFIDAMSGHHPDLNYPREQECS